MTRTSRARGYSVVPYATAPAATARHSDTNYREMEGKRGGERVEVVMGEGDEM